MLPGHNPPSKKIIAETWRQQLLGLLPLRITALLTDLEEILPRFKLSDACVFLTTAGLSQVGSIHCLPQTKASLDRWVLASSLATAN